MTSIGTFLDLGILWFLIVLFTGSIDADQSYRETWIVIFGVMIVGLVFRSLLGDPLRPLATPFQVVTLYFLVEWSCGTDRKTTLKICGWYLVASVAMSTAFYFLTRPQ
ncbi:MAG: hypothetical protein JNM65_06685 [Verrucomicrobiaceae bacterium]|nr:hypothetical protein [Verrucomicrobiaceae bacterium]